MLCDCDIKEKACYYGMCQNGSAERQSSESFCTFSCETQREWGRKVCRGVSQPSTESRSAWTTAKVSTDGQAVVERLLWIVTACGVPQFKTVSLGSWASMQEDLRLKWRLCGELSLSLEPSPALWKDHCSCLLSAPSALNAARCSLMTSNLLRLEGWSSSQMERLGRSFLRETEERPLLVSGGRKRECPHFVKNETSSIRHVDRLRCIQWRSDTSDLVYVWVSTDCKGIRGQVSWQVGSLDEEHLWHVICHCCASTE